MHKLLSSECLLILLSVVCHILYVSGFSSNSHAVSITTHHKTALYADVNEDSIPEKVGDRRNFITSSVAGGILLAGMPGSALAEEDDFASLAARAAKLSREQDTKVVKSIILSTDTTAYNFSLPVSGVDIPFKDLVKQEYDSEGFPNKIKAILVVNIKQDDPTARKDIPEMIFLASKYGKDGLCVIACPTDQGYYEPDTSALLRLKLASEYGYGINPSTVVTDKVNFLGTGAHPFWRWMENTCRAPSGLGRLQGNFEKFLLDGRTGLPLRRYPRKYAPVDIKYDIESILEGRRLPPAGANFAEQWRQAAIESERDTYRFQKGLNVYDQ